MRFRATIETNGRTATGFEVPDAVVEALDRGKRPPVSVTIGPHTYRSTVAVMGGRYLLPLSAENRTAAGVSAGDVVDVDVELDDAPRTVDVPDDLAGALQRSPAARSFFDNLSFSNQRRLVESITGAKKAETRQRRVEKVIELLEAGRVS
jgi:hypothetical protein